MKNNAIYRSLRRVWHSIISLHGSPHDIALGTAIGVFVAFSPTLGIQMIIAVLVATAFGANRAAAVIPVWITNPLTAVPIYGFTYWVGAFFWEGPPAREVLKELARVTKGFAQYRFYNVVDIFKEFIQLGFEVIAPMTLGGLLIGFVLACAIYPVTLQAVTKYRKIKEHILDAKPKR